MKYKARVALAASALLVAGLSTAAVGTAAHAAGTPTYVGKTTASGANTSLTLAAPTGTVSGDVQVAFVEVGTNSETLGAAPSGWTLKQIAHNTSGSNSSQTAIYTSTTATGNVTFTKSGSRGWVITRLDYTNASGVGATAISGVQANGTSHATPSITTTGATSLVVGMVGADRNSGPANQTWSSPSGWTERQDTDVSLGSNPDVESETVGDVAVATSGTATTGTFVASQSTVAIAGAVEVLATSGGGGGGSWTNVVDDEFNTAGVPSHWAIYDGHYSSSDGCANPSHVTAPGDGFMHIKMFWDTNWCAPNGGWEVGGMQISASLGAINQRVTVRWQVTSTDPTNVRSHRIIPMRWVDDPNFQWYQGESDYCEGSEYTGCSSFLHYSTSGQIQHDYTVDLTQMHTWRFEHGPNHLIKAYIDDLVNPVWTYQGDATTIPDAIRRTVLQQECRSTCPSGTTGSEDIKIDWITIDNAS